MVADPTTAGFVGYEVDGRFVVGCGSDYGGLHRNLPLIGVLKARHYEHEAQ